VHPALDRTVGDISLGQRHGRVGALIVHGIDLPARVHEADRDALDEDSDWDIGFKVTELANG
jgi:hypothetical protein